MIFKSVLKNVISNLKVKKMYKMNYSDQIVRSIVLTTYMKKKFNIVILGISKPQENGNRVLIKNPDYDVKVESGDYLILVCNGKRDKEIQSFFGIEEGYIHN